MSRSWTLAGLLGGALASSAIAVGPRKAAPPDSSSLAARVREEMAFCWGAYEKHAWGRDELKPLTKTGKDWYGESLLMTPVDALDTLLLMGLKEEAERAK